MNYLFLFPKITCQPFGQCLQVETNSEVFLLVTRNDKIVKVFVCIKKKKRFNALTAIS